MIAASFLLLLAPQAAAPEAPAACTAAPALPAGMEGWAKPQAMQAGTSASQAALLPLGSGVTAALLPTPKVAYAVRPEKPGGSVSSGGMFAFDVAMAGRYRIALGSGAWVDVLSGTTPAVSAAHGHGPECSGIRKMVDFDLQPGRYLLQIAGNGTPTLPLMVSRIS